MLGCIACVAAIGRFSWLLGGVAAQAKHKRRDYGRGRKKFFYKISFHQASPLRFCVPLSSGGKPDYSLCSGN
jgi:hypothetical protein